MAENTIDVNIQPHILAAIDSNKALQDAAKGPGIKKADRKKILAETDSIAGRISAVQDLVNNNSISGDKALKEIQSIFTTLSKATISLMGYSNAVKAELTRLNDEIQQKRNELNNIKDEYINLKGSPNKIVYAGRQKDKNGEFIPGTEESISQYSLPGEDIEKIVSQTAPDIHEKITSKQRLQDIANGEDSTITDPKAIQEAAEALKLVESAQTNIRGLLNDNLNLQKQLNEEVDKLNVVLDQTNEKADITKGTDITSLENLQNAYGEMQKQIEKLQAAIEALNNEKSKAKDNAGAAAAVEEKEEKSVKKTDGTVTKAIKSFFGYQQVIRALRTVVNFTVKTITDLDKALTDQAIVSGLSRDQTWQLVSSYESLAQQTGFTTTEIAKTASKFLQQGKTVSETLELTKAAAESARVAGISASQAVDYLTTALNGFQMSADQSLEVSDKFAALAASSATSYEELATALSKVASQANLAGMSMDYTLALLAKGVETTRESAESIGTALKTVVARMREITDYGDTLSDGTNINNVEKQLSMVGIALRGTDGQLRSTEEVLDEVGRKWDELSTNQQASIAKALAGTRQQSRLIAMMSNYKRTLELMEISKNSLGATNAQQAKYMQSMEAAMNSVKTAWQGLSTTLTSSEVIIQLVNDFAGFINALKNCTAWIGKIDKKTGNFISKYMIIFPIFVALLVAGFFAIAVAFNGMGSKIKEVCAKITVSIESIPIIGWIAAIIAGIISLIAFIKQLGDALGWWKKGAEKASDAIKQLAIDVYNLKKEASDLKTVTDAWDELDKHIIKTAQDSKDAASYREKLISLLQQKDSSKYADASSWTDASLRSEAEKIQAEDKEQASSKQKSILFQASNVHNSLIDYLTGNNAKESFWKDSVNVNNVKGALNYEGSDLISNKDWDSETKVAAQDFYQNFISALSVNDLENMTSREMTDLAEKVIDSLGETGMENVKAMNDETKTLKERVQAYEDVYNALPDEAKNTFAAANSELASLAASFTDITYKIIDQYGITTKSLNALSVAMSNIGMSKEQTASVIDFTNQFLKSGGNAKDLAAALQKQFGLTEEAAKKLAKATLDAYAGGDTVQAVTQQQTAIESEISAIRKAQSEWSTKSQEDRTTFMNDHQDYFAQRDENGNIVKDSNGNVVWDQQKYSDFVSGKDLTSNLKSSFNNEIDVLRQKYMIQLQRAQEEGDSVAVAEAQAALDNLESIAEESLDDIVTKQQSQIKLYKDYLKQQQTDLTDSLNARKEAYQDYFNAINAAYEETDFATEEARLQQQIVKLSGGTDATSQNKILDLQNQLSTLEKNHSETTVKNAQQAVLDNIDDEIDVINNYYDKMLNSDKLMLNAMNAWLAQGKSQDEYKQYLEGLGYTDDEVAQAMESFAKLTADGKVAESSWVNANTDALDKNTTSLDALALMQAYNVAQSLAANNGLSAPEITKDGNNTYIQFNDKRFELNGDQATSLSDLLVNLMKAAKTTTGV